MSDQTPTPIALDAQAALAWQNLAAGRRASELPRDVILTDDTGAGWHYGRHLLANPTASLLDVIEAIPVGDEITRIIVVWPGLSTPDAHSPHSEPVRVVTAVSRSGHAISLFAPDGESRPRIQRDDHRGILYATMVGRLIPSTELDVELDSILKGNEDA